MIAALRRLLSISEEIEGEMKSTYSFKRSQGYDILQYLFFPSSVVPSFTSILELPLGFFLGRAILAGPPGGMAKYESWSRFIPPEITVSISIDEILTRVVRVKNTILHFPMITDQSDKRVKEWRDMVFILIVSSPWQRYSTHSSGTR